VACEKRLDTTKIPRLARCSTTPTIKPVEKSPKINVKKGVLRERITGNGATPTQAQSRLEENWIARFNSEKEKNPRSKKIKVMAKDRTLKWLYEQWQEANEDGEVSDIMVKKYEGYFRLHILPHLGERKLDSLTSRDFRQLFTKTLPSKPGKGGQASFELHRYSQRVSITL
jgi:hypothetical protein